MGLQKKLCKNNDGISPRMMIISTMFVVIVMFIGILIGSGIYPLTAFNTNGEDVIHRDYETTLDLTDSDYATHWESSGESEDITCTGKVRRIQSTSYHKFSTYRYVAYVNNDIYKTYPLDGSFIKPSRVLYPETNKWYNLDTWTFNIQGAVFGELKVVMEIVMKWKIGTVSYDGPGGWDGAFLKSGEGEIFVDGTERTFEEGDTVRLSVKTGFTNNAGWTVKLYPPSTRTELFTPRVLGVIEDDRYSSISILIEEGWFRSGDVIDNTFHVELSNGLFPVGFDEFFSVDMISRIPTAPTLSIKTTDVKISVTMTSEETFTTIKGFKIWAWYGTASKPSFSDGERWIVLGDEINTGTTGFYDFDIKNKDGNVVIQVIAVDIDGRASQPAFHYFIVEDNVITDDGGGIEPVFDIITFIIFIAIGVLILLALTRKEIPGDPMIKILFGIMILAIMFLIGFIVSGGMV